MSTIDSSRAHACVERRGGACATAIFLLSALVCSNALALSKDREQELRINAQYQKTQLGDTSSGSAGFSVLRGNVRIVQGSLKANGDEATLHDRSAKSGLASSDTQGVKRIVLTGKPAHLEQLLDGGGKVLADANSIDYDTETGIAELTGNVIVVQQGRSEFRGPHMTYNTNTGAMEGGAQGQGEVQLIFQPKAKSPPAPARDDASDTGAKP